MRSLFIALLFNAVLLVASEATSATTDSTVGLGDLVSADQYDLDVKRRLRKRDENDDGERTISISSVSTVSGKATTWTFHNGDEALRKVLEAVKKTSSANDILKKLQVRPRNQRSVDNMFELLKLDEGVSKLLTSPNLNAFVTYMNVFNRGNPAKETTLVKTMTISYGDELLAKALEAAKHVPSTRKMATDLQMAQFSMWLSEGAKPSQIWKILKMNKATWMTNPDAQIWRGYNEFFKLHQ
nr:RxLR effector protein PSR2 [Phytophthora ramorum]KAH7496251.1 RxLR effector protein PSR2 [Phytophthora ramorum]